MSNKPKKITTKRIVQGTAVGAIAVGAVATGVALNNNLEKGAAHPDDRLQEKTKDSTHNKSTDDILKDHEKKRHNFSDTASAKKKLEAQRQDAKAHNREFFNHVVSDKDSIFLIAREAGISVDQLLKDNGLKPGDALKVGQALKVRNPDYKTPQVEKQAAQGTPTNVPVATNDAPAPAEPTPAPAPAPAPNSNAKGETTPVNPRNDSHPTVDPSDQKARDDAQRQKDEAQRKAREAEAAKRAEQARKAEAERKLTEELNVQNRQALNELNVKRGAAQVRVDQTKQAYDAENAKLADAQALVATAQQHVNQANTAVGAAQTNVQTATNGKTAAQMKVTSTQSTIDTAKAELAKATITPEKKAEIEAQLAKDEALLVQANTELAAADQALNAANQELTQATPALATANAELASAQQHLTEVQAKIAVAKQAFDDATSTLNSLPKTVDAKTSAAARAIQADLAKIEQNIAKLDQQITTLNQQVAQLDQQIQTIDQKAKDASQQADHATEHAKDADKQADDATTHNKKADDHANEAHHNLPHIPTNKDIHVTINVDEDGNKIDSTDGYHKVKESDEVKTVETLPNGDTVTTYTNTVTWHKIANTDKHVTLNVDEAGHAINSTEGYHKIKTSDAVKTIETLPNGDTITTYTTTVTWHKIANKEAHVVVNRDENGNTIASTDGYHKVKESGEVKTIETLPNGDTVTTYTNTITWHKIANTDKHVVINIDETGHAIDSTEGYMKVKESGEIKTVETLSNGDTITTYTNTITWHKVNNHDKHVVVNVDEDGHAIDSTEGYRKVKESKPVITYEKDKNGDTITVYTVTVTWHKIANKDVHVTINVDEAGHKIDSTDGYHKIKESGEVKTIETLPNGDTITTYTNTITWHKIANKEEHVTVNVDEAGNKIDSTEGYMKVKESDAVKTVKTLPNGDTVTTYTTTVTWHKTHNTDKHVTINVDENGNKIDSTDGYHKVKESEVVKTVETLPNGDTITTYTTTITWHKVANTDKHVIINVDEDGNKIDSTDGYHKMNESGEIKTVETLPNGDTITTYTNTITWHKVKHIDKSETINVDENGNKIDSTDGYDYIDGADKVTTKTETLDNGDIVTTTITTKMYRKQGDDIIRHINKATDQAVKDIETQITQAAQAVTVEQADRLVNHSFSDQINALFAEMVRAEQAKYGDDQINVTPDKEASREMAERAVEIASKFDHERPENDVPNGHYAIDRKTGDAHMAFSSESIAQFDLDVSKAGGDSAKLAQMIAEQMFEQFINAERDAARNGGSGDSSHYKNIVESGYSDITSAIYIVKEGGTYHVYVATSTGNHMTE